MTGGPARTAIPILVVLVIAAMLGWFIAGRQPSSPPGPGDATASRPAADGVAAAPPAAPAEPGAAVPASSRADLPAPAGAAAPDAAANQTAKAGEAEPPSFDVVRVEPSGASVIAGRSSPGATVELLRNGEPFARVVADSSGLFAIVPPPLPPGSHEIMLQASQPDGGRRLSAQSVTVVIAATRDQRPLVTVTAPDRPTVVLSQPDEPGARVASAAPPAVVPGPQPRTDGRRTDASTPPLSPTVSPEIRIGAVEAEGGGRLYVSGQASPGATVRLYLNDTFIAPGATGPDGRMSFTIERGIRAGDYRIRLDQVDPVTGAVKSRAEVQFTVPAPSAPAIAAAPPAVSSAGAASRPAELPPRSPGVVAAPPAGPTPAPARGPITAGLQPAAPRAQSDAADAQAAARPRTAAVEADPGAVVVPEINTAIVSRGDNLWRISKRVYGAGLRYTVIFGANTPQIRNPDLIYPGQVFVLPAGN